jgi:hypothetical protein
MAQTTVEQVVDLARELSRAEQLQVIQRLAPGLTDDQRLDDQYQRGYEQTPESAGDISALLRHLPLPTENWE